MNTRRAFLLGLGKAAATVAAAPLALTVLEACTPTSVPMAPVQGGNPVGPDGRVAIDISDLTAASPAKVATGITGADGFGIMITRISETDYRALSMRCTHQNCPVDAALSNGEIHCNCHNSLFALDGSVLQSPATVPLSSYNVVLDAATKTVHVKI